MTETKNKASILEYWRAIELFSPQNVPRSNSNDRIEPAYMVSTVIDRYAPVQIGSGFIAVSAGDFHSLALKADGTLWGWGVICLAN
jgi:hypothetical protein